MLSQRVDAEISETVNVNCKGYLILFKNTIEPNVGGQRERLTDRERNSPNSNRSLSEQSKAASQFRQYLPLDQ